MRFSQQKDTIENVNYYAEKSSQLLRLTPKTWYDIVSVS